MIDKDLIGIVEVKQKVSSVIKKFSSKSRSSEQSSFLTFRWIFEYVLCSWQFSPILTLLFLRHNGRSYRDGTELIMMVVSAIISTLWWTIYSLIIIGGYNFVR